MHTSITRSVILATCAVIAPCSLTGSAADKTGCYRMFYSADWLREHEAQTISEFHMLYYDDRDPSFEVSLRRAGDMINFALDTAGDCDRSDGFEIVCRSCFGGGFTIVPVEDADAIEIDASRPFGFFNVAEAECGARNAEVTTILAKEMPQPRMRVEGYFCRGAF